MHNNVGDKMIDRSQLMKGTLEGCILKIIGLGETYGYEIVSKLQGYGFSDVREGTIYPILIRLEKKGLIHSFFKESPLGPQRKYFILTALGAEMLSQFLEVWKEMRTIVDQIMEEEYV